MATSATPTVTVLEQCPVAPPSGTAAELSLPLTFFDTIWWNFLPMQNLLFYKFPHPKAHFVEVILPKLKESLSLTLKHFLPIAGNLVHPSDSGKLELRYAEGDSIPLILAESSDDFDDLVGNHARNADRFYPLVPPLPPKSIASGTTRTPLFAIQVTVFPNSGISIGWSNRHVIGDAWVIVAFLKAWASMNKLSGDARLLAGDSLPSFDRSVIEDPFQMDSTLFNAMKMLRSQESSPASTFLTDKVRATHEISQENMQKLKKFVLAKRPNIVHASSFTVTCAYIWTSWLKSMDAIGDKVDEDKPEYFLVQVDCRGRWDPPIPPNFFGNCLVTCIVTSTHGKLVGSEGLLIAAELIGEAIRKRVHDKEGILNGSWLAEQYAMSGQKPLGVAGSLKYNFYDVDFGWGKPEKYESIAIDVTGAISVSKPWKLEAGGLEVTLSLPKNRMDAFATIFNHDFKIL